MSLFCDQTKIKVLAGNGGNGCLSFRREKYVPKGGPDGGNGGIGGDIIFKVNANLNTLTKLETVKELRAESGQTGKGELKNGKNGEDLIIEVPLGTLIKDSKTDELLCDMATQEIAFVAAKGGRGGFGNAHFKSSVRQAPKFAEYGEEGESLELELELKLVADVAIIGIPSAGKSTLISVISNAKPKIADYPFTTLIPHLGVCGIHGKDIVFADIPGLIEGAHHGKGLGVQFLKHIERTKILIHLIDPTNAEADIMSNYEIINKELELFNKDLAKKPQVVAVNKIDILSDKTIAQLKKDLKKLKPFFISAATKKNLQPLLQEAYEQLKKYEETHQKETTKITEEHKVFRPHLEDTKYFSVEKIRNNIFTVRGKRIEQIVKMSDMENNEALYRIYDVMKKLGIQKQLRQLGAKEGDKIRIADKKLDFHEI